MFKSQRQSITSPHGPPYLVGLSEIVCEQESEDTALVRQKVSRVLGRLWIREPVDQCTKYSHRNQRIIV